MRRIALLTFLAGLYALTPLRAQSAAPVDARVMQEDREFLKSQSGEPAGIPGLKEALQPPAPAPIAEYTPPAAPVADSAVAKPVRKEVPLNARTKPAPPSRAEVPTQPKESKVARVAPKTKPIPTPEPAPRVVVRERVVRAVPVVREESRRPEGGFHPPTSVERHDRDDDDDDAEEAAESEAFHRTVRGFFHRLRGS